ncbi:hypothetical protein BC629DRAFT_1461023 [Irpex lacteus]|nr:hypothetical protein BC629DRAFT_1461023 [Irpex lacteus]
MKFNVSYLLTIFAIATSANAICCIYSSAGSCARGLEERGNLALLREEDLLARGELEHEKRACCCAAGNAKHLSTDQD